MLALLGSSWVRPLGFPFEIGLECITFFDALDQESFTDLQKRLRREFRKVVPATKADIAQYFSFPNVNLISECSELKKKNRRRNWRDFIFSFKSLGEKGIICPGIFFILKIQRTLCSLFMAVLLFASLKVLWNSVLYQRSTLN